MVGCRAQMGEGVSFEKFRGEPKCSNVFIACEFDTGLPKMLQTIMSCFIFIILYKSIILMFKISFNLIDV